MKKWYHPSWRNVEKGCQRHDVPLLPGTWTKGETNDGKPFWYKTEDLVEDSQGLHAPPESCIWIRPLDQDRLAELIEAREAPPPSKWCQCPPGTWHNDLPHDQILELSSLYVNRRSTVLGNK